MFGRDCNELQDYVNVDVVNMKGDETDWTEHQRKLISIIYPSISTRILDKKKKMVEHMNMKRRSVVLKGLPAGTAVMLNDPRRQNKFEPKYIGPYNIVRRTRNGTYVLRDAAGDLLDRHVQLDQLKVLSKKEAKVKVDDVYEVEKIIEHKGEPGNYSYLVKWKGYENDGNTWEHQASFFDDGVIKKYWATAQ